MSKYNLTDILEQYRIGSGFTPDFDYAGMLKAGLAIKEDTPLEIMKDIVEDFTDVNYHREAAHLYDAIEAIEANNGDYDAGEDKIKDFQQEIMMTIKSQGMDIEPTLGKFMDTKMSSMMNEDEFDEARQAAIESSQKAAGIKEAREFVSVDGEVSTRIESFLNKQLKAKFLAYFKQMFYDLVEDEVFDLEDIVAHLSNEMGNAILGDPVAMDRLPYLDKSSNDDDFEQEEFTAIDEEDSIEEAKNRDIRTALKRDAKGTDAEIDSYFTSLMKAGDTFDTMEDYVEDFQNYIADKSLQEHFNRFK